MKNFNPTLLSYLLLVLAYTSMHGQNCQPGSAQIDLATNEVSARLLTGGDLWWNLDEGKYLYPSNAQTSLIFAGGIFIGGLTENDDIRISSVTYRTVDGTSYRPGPVADNTTCEDWDRFWVIDRAAVEAHKADYADNDVIDTELDQIYAWPARGNAFFEGQVGFALPDSDSPLAPFSDYNANGLYEPHLGEHPAVKGDQLVWWVINDVVASSPQLPPVGAELQLSAYSSDAEPVSKNTYYDLRVIYKGVEPLKEFYASIFLDFDIGCPDDDFFGYDEQSGLVYMYNEDRIDGITSTGACPVGGQLIPSYGSMPPVLGLAILDDQPHQRGITAVQGRNRIMPQGQSAELNLNTFKGIWPDGTPQTRGGNGYNPGSTDTTTYLFTDPPADPAGWSMCTASLPFDDRMLFVSSGGYAVQPGDVIDISYVLFTVDDVALPCPSIGPIIDALTDATSLPTSTSDSDRLASKVSIHPNPTADTWLIVHEQSISSLIITDILGKNHLTLRPDSKTVDVDARTLPPGVYVATIINDQDVTLSTKVIRK